MAAVSVELWNVDPPLAGECDTAGLEPLSCDVSPRRHPGAVTAELASAREGIVGRRDLLEAGLTRHVIEGRARTGEFHRIHRGVYVAGHAALAPKAAEYAALMACGERSLISHRSAAYLWSMPTTRPDEIDVTLVGRRCRPKQSVRLHFVARIDDADVRPMDNLLLTAPARTLVDFAAEAEDDELEAALSEARALRLVKDGELEAALDRAGIRRGVARLRRLLRLENDSGYTRSRAERLMWRLMRGGGLPQPLCNRHIHGCRVDFVWPGHKLVVEVDGYQFHGIAARSSATARRIRC
jgi:hypothetical protein